jgi:hypothetical protein
VTDGIRYIESETGGIHTVTEEHLERHLMTEPNNNGNRYLLPGYKEITEREAKKRNPQLFGAPDPQVTLTDDELVRAAQRKKLLDELFPNRSEDTPEE